MIVQSRVIVHTVRGKDFFNLDASETKQNRSEAVRPTKEISEGNISEEAAESRKRFLNEPFFRGADERSESARRDRFGEVAARTNLKKPMADSKYYFCFPAEWRLFKDSFYSYFLNSCAYRSECPC